MADLPADDSLPRRRVTVLGSEMAFVEIGSGDLAIVFLHGNPTSSYLWRNIMPAAAELGRCLAPDLIGMGQSSKVEGCNYSFADHATYLDAWFDTVLPIERVMLVVHDWGGALGFRWARRHADRIAAIAYMETIVTPLVWADWPERARGIFQAMRSPAGEELVLQKNVFVERILPSSIIRELGDAEMAAYRAPFTEPGEGRRPTLTWPRQIPIESEPEAVVSEVEANEAWLSLCDVPKLFINADPGSILVGRPRDRCRAWPNQEEVTVPGLHFIQEDSPQEIGDAVAGLAQTV